MAEEILSVALWEPNPQMEATALATFHELTSIVAGKGYGRDFLYRDRDQHYVFLRYWKSEEARRIAQQLVERGLAACVNVLGPIESIYRWQGKVETAGEFLLLIKTTAERFPDLREALVALHSYEVPECIAIDVTDGSAPYLAWLADSVR